MSPGVQPHPAFESDQSDSGLVKIQKKIFERIRNRFSRQPVIYFKHRRRLTLVYTLKCTDIQYENK